MRKISVTHSFSTTMPVDKVRKVGDEAGIKVSHIETRFAGKGKWVNDYEAIGSPGKVTSFIERINDLRHD